MKRCILLLALAAALSAGCSEARHADARVVSVAAVQPRIVGARPAERATVQGIVAKLMPTAISRVALRRDAKGVHMVVTSSAPNDLRSGWDEQLLVDQYVATHAVRPLADARTDDSLVYKPTSDLPRARPRATARIRRRIEGIAKAGGASVVELRSVDLGASTLAVTLATRHPARFIKAHSAALLAALRGHDAWYVGIDDGRGKTVWALDHLWNSGGYFPGPFDECDRVEHSQPAGAPPPPPCPVG